MDLAVVVNRNDTNDGLAESIAGQHHDAGDDPVRSPRIAATLVVTTEEAIMRHVGVREFKNQATSMMSAGETLVIERHGKPIGFFVPVEAKDRERGRAALGRLGRAVDTVLADTGLDEEQLVEELTGKRRR